MRFIPSGFLRCASHSLNSWKVFTSQRQQVMRLQLQQKLFQVPSFILVGLYNQAVGMWRNIVWMINVWKISILGVLISFWFFMWCLNLWLTYLDLDFHLWLDMRSFVFRVFSSHIGRLGSCNGTRIARQALLNDLWKGPTTLRPIIGIVVLSYCVIHCLKPYQYVSVLKDFLLHWRMSRFQSQSTARLAAGEGCSCSAFVSTLPLQERLEACGKWLRTCFFFFSGSLVLSQWCWWAVDSQVREKDSPHFAGTPERLKRLEIGVFSKSLRETAFELPNCPLLRWNFIAESVPFRRLGDAGTEKQ